ncbi:MAG: NADP-dependent oxidoreductase [Nevskiaceae bacterium]|jgi:NADPH:quinone reductase-like Zn-dependent oxidoreductase|nr:NADP-dependent oxidoreductase [Nevskiaceae bacterium]
MSTASAGMKRCLAVLAAAICAAASVHAAAPPAQMQAIVQNSAGLSLQTVQTPKAGAGQVLVKVYAAGVNPVDWKRQPPVPGFDAAGVVEALGPDVTTFKVGEPVVARVAGGYAQYALAQVEDVTPKPKAFTYEQASGMPVAGVAGFRAATEVKIKPGQRVAVIGAAGGAGSTAVQVAKSLGAQVVGVGHSSQREYLTGLGVAEFVAYDKDDVAARVSGMDAVLNMVEGQAAAALGYLRRGGTLASIAGGAPEDSRCRSAGVTCMFIGGGSGAGYSSISNAQALAGLSKLADAGQYQVLVSKTFPLAQAAAAQQLNRTSDTVGKIVLVVDPQAGQR